VGFYDHSLWEQTKKRGDSALRKLIDHGMRGASVTVVLIGAETASRRWVRYEIEKSHELNKGLMGVHINRLKDRTSNIDRRGANPFEQFVIRQNWFGRVTLADRYPTYDWVTDRGYENFSAWVESAAKADGR
jgi:hypothetical protein